MGVVVCNKSYSYKIDNSRYRITAETNIATIFHSVSVFTQVPQNSHPGPGFPAQKTSHLVMIVVAVCLRFLETLLGGSKRGTAGAEGGREGGVGQWVNTE